MCLIKWSSASSCRRAHRLFYRRDGCLFGYRGLGRHRDHHHDYHRSHHRFRSATAELPMLTELF